MSAASLPTSQFYAFLAGRYHAMALHWIDMARTARDQGSRELAATRVQMAREAMHQYVGKLRSARSAISLPGHTRQREWIDQAAQRGFTEVDA